jgi:CXXC-20-CXXC protein
MDTCKKCNQKFSYWQVYKNYWRSKEQIQCLSCATKHEHHFTNRLLLFVVLFIPALIQSLLQYYEIIIEMNFFLVFTLLYFLFGAIGSLLTNFLFNFKLAN